MTHSVVIEVRYHPIFKTRGLGPMRVLYARPHPGETAFRFASRELNHRYKVRDYLIMDTQVITA